MTDLPADAAYPRNQRQTSAAAWTSFRRPSVDIFSAVPPPNRSTHPITGTCRMLSSPTFGAVASSPAREYARS